jgi:3-hydroxyisobutyrate dehydrogenase-like beta-hydroxyacid dehydrogenase
VTGVDVKRVTVVGLGAMGGGIAGRLLGAGFAVTVFNRTREKADALVAGGARLAGTAREGADADALVVSLADEDAVEGVVFGDLAPHLRPGAVVVDTSTVSPSYSRRAEARLTASGVSRVEACLIGNPQMALGGDLRVFAAGTREAVATVRPLLDALSRQGFLHLGATGRASAMKLAFNLLLGANTAALAEAVAFAEAVGLDRELLLTALAKSGWRSPVLNYRAEFMRTRRYEPAGFRARLMAKDLTPAHGEACARGLELPLAGHALRRFEEAVAAGLGDKDAAVVAELDAGDRRHRGEG